MEADAQGLTSLGLDALGARSVFHSRRWGLILKHMDDKTPVRPTTWDAVEQ